LRPLGANSGPHSRSAANVHPSEPGTRARLPGGADARALCAPFSVSSSRLSAAQRHVAGKRFRSQRRSATLQRAGGRKVAGSNPVAPIKKSPANGDPQESRHPTTGSN
jgi:hypothetical protein